MQLKCTQIIKLALLLLLAFVVVGCGRVAEPTDTAATDTATTEMTTTEATAEAEAATASEATTESETATTLTTALEQPTSSTELVEYELADLDKERIAWLQEQLKIAGYYTLIDGIYGADSQAKLNAFCVDQMGRTYPHYNSAIEAALIAYNRDRIAGDIDDYLVYATKSVNLQSTDTPSRLVDLGVDHIIAEGVEQIEEKTNQQLIAMFGAAKQEGVTLRVVSAYRSFEYQIRLFNRRVQARGFERTNRSTAQPGQSEHQTGLVVDLDDGTWTHTVKQSFDQTAAFRWLDAHAHEYGFILSYPKGKEEITGYMYEPWHYRFVGSAEVATEIKQRDMTLEQYVKALRE